MPDDDDQGENDNDQGDNGNGNGDAPYIPNGPEYLAMKLQNRVT